MTTHAQDPAPVPASSEIAPLVSHIFTADPSAHVFNGRLYVYPSHDVETTIADNDNGDQYAMNDYHVLSLPSITGPVTDHGVVLSLADVPWADKQLWAPDAAEKDGKYYFFFPARNREGYFQIGVAVAERPEGPFVPEKEPIKGSYSIDPASFVDEDGKAYLYFGGIWGGQLQCWQGEKGVFERGMYETMEARDGPALCARVARLSEDMKSFVGEDEPVEIRDGETGEMLHSSDHDRRFFEAAWMHKRNGVYYFSYSTGDTHYLCYATGDSPMGPFTYRGRILEPVVGWTTHHSIVEFEGRWWLFHHDASLSKGTNHLRCVKVRELWYNEDGSLTAEDPKTKSA